MDTYSARMGESVDVNSVNHVHFLNISNSEIFLDLQSEELLIMN